MSAQHGAVSTPGRVALVTSGEVKEPPEAAEEASEPSEDSEATTDDGGERGRLWSGDRTWSSFMELRISANFRGTIKKLRRAEKQNAAEWVEKAKRCRRKMELPAPGH